MQILVIGCGKVGSRFAQVLSSEGHEVAIVDNDRESFKVLGPDFSGITVTGVPIDQDVLKQAGIETADVVAALTPDDNVNIMASQVAKEIFKVPKVIARIYNPEREHVFHQFGLDTICPTDITVDVLRSKILAENEICEYNIAGICFLFKYIKAEKKDEGRKLGSIKLKDGEVLFGISRKGVFIHASPSVRLIRDDIIVVAENKSKPGA
jgi:trk system potassium uptake protein